VGFIAGVVTVFPPNRDSADPQRSPRNSTSEGMCYVATPWQAATAWTDYGLAAATPVQTRWPALSPFLVIVVALFATMGCGASFAITAMLASSPSAPCGCRMRTFHRRPVQVVFACGLQARRRGHKQALAQHIAPACAAAVAHLVIPSAVGLALPLHALLSPLRERILRDFPLLPVTAFTTPQLAFDVLLPVGVCALASLVAWTCWDDVPAPGGYHRRRRRGHELANLWDEDGNLKSRGVLNADRVAALQQTRSRAQRKRVVWLFNRLHRAQRRERAFEREADDEEDDDNVVAEAAGEDVPAGRAGNGVAAAPMPPLLGRSASDVMVGPYTQPPPPAPAKTEGSAAAPQAVVGGRPAARRRRGRGEFNHP
jgi:hypothetical protein